VTGRCEKIDLETWSNFGLEKNRARMPFKRLLDLRLTFRFRRNFSEIDFFTSFQTGLSLRETRVCYGSKVSSRCLRSVTIFLRGPRFCGASEKWRPGPDTSAKRLDETLDQSACPRPPNTWFPGIYRLGEVAAGTSAKMDRGQDILTYHSLIFKLGLGASFAAVVANVAQSAMW
jgi:hypothetical protein